MGFKRRFISLFIEFNYFFFVIAGCSPTQLSIAWSLKHEPVQCLLIGATTPELLHQSLQALQV